MDSITLSNLENILNGRKKLVLGIGVLSSLFIVYLYKERSKKQSDTGVDDDTVIQGRQTIIEVKVPIDCVRSLIGQQGQNIKELQQKTKTRMNFKDRLNQNLTEQNGLESNQENNEVNQKEPDRILVIRGSNINVQRAEFEIKKFILDNPISITQDFYVPQYACGRIIGKGGQTIREISSPSIETLSDIPENSTDQTFRVIRITGSNERISFAKELVANKIKEEQLFREKRNKKYRN
ncbi:unnamed protein product [Brachionus calyciflorus]|uniref:K Homology domain-containing protein n=1 Tax=Brachionus calyciflorus TaxID=104777 RepID=A0A813RRS3_9BILA|nr:unnamed protein product [Brachionus calyciflorus]